MKLHERELYCDKNGNSAQIERRSGGYYLTMWSGFSIVNRATYRSYDTVHDLLIKAGYQKEA